MRRAFQVALVAAMLLAMVTFGALGAPAYKVVKVRINGHDASLPGYLIDGLTYVPLRVISESMGAAVSWDSSTMTASVSEYPLDTEPTRSGDKGVLHTLSLDQIKDAMTFGQANQQQEFEDIFGEYTTTCLADWIGWTQGATLYTPWSAIASQTWYSARNNQALPSPEEVRDWDGAKELAFTFVVAGQGSDSRRLRAYVRQGANIFPVDTLTQTKSEAAGNPQTTNMQATFFTATHSGHGLDMSGFLELLVADQSDHLYVFKWNLYDLK